jgi:soluble lytic murein transglycosylase-like protein
MPDTASRYGVRDIFDPVENVYAGVHYLHDLKLMFNGNTQLAVAAYNAGENAVLRFGGVPPYPETINYVSRVTDLHGRYRQGM